MPPPRCLHTVPLRTIDNSLSSRSSRSISASSAHSFSTSSRYAAANQPSGGPSKGVTTLRLKKKGPPVKSTKPPDIGERRALRKRIVLSNTNALEVNKLEPLKPELVADNASKIYTLPAEVLDQLRAVEAFKPKQGWAFFQTPAVLMRQEARNLGSDMDKISKNELVDQKTKGMSRKVICGEKGAGKSVLLLQTMAMAFQRGWIVINLPEGRDLSNAHTAFSPIPGSKNPVQYTQPAYTAKLLQLILTANKDVLSKLMITEKPKLPFPVKDDISLGALLEMGVDDPDRAWPIFQVFWSEITKANSSIDAKKLGARPPVLMCLDNMSHVMLDSKYQVLNSADKLTPVHSHDLVLVKHFFDHLAGSAVLANGGMILAATSASDAPKSDAMEVGIAIAETRQNIASSKDTKQPPKESPYQTAYTSLQKLSPDRDPSPTALSNFWSPFKPIDKRVLDVLKDISVVRLEGVNHEEATTLMRYWAWSGVNRGTVLPWTVDEARGMSGGGVVGQLEQAVVRSIQREPFVVYGEPGGKKIRVH